MAIDFNKWDKKYNVSSDDVKAIEKNGGKDYPEVPFGQYEVSIKKLELGSSKKGDPMLICQFKILDGKFKNSLIFMNQLVTTDFQIHIADEFLRSLDSGVEVEWLGSYGKYADLIDNIFDAVTEDKLEYALDYSSTDKGYSKFEITEVFGD